MLYDVAVVGAGVIGAHTARILSHYQLRVALLEREHDIGMGTSKANSAIVHAGFDARPGSLKARFNVEGVRMMPALAEELHIPYHRIGSLLVAYAQEELPRLHELLRRGRENGVPDLELLDRDALHAMEPHLNPQALAALHAPSAGIICPFELCLAAAEHAVLNGCDLLRGFKVDRIVFTENGADSFFTVFAGEKSVQARYLVNCAGVHCPEIAGMIGDDSLHVIPRKGEYMLLDKTQGRLARHVLFQCPSAMGKGVLVTPTVDGNLLVGPSAVDIEDLDDVSTTAQTLAYVLESAKKTIPSLTTREVITSFAGLRAHGDRGDFILEPSKVNSRMIHAAGVESPGLSASPAIAQYLVQMLVDTAGFRRKAEVIPRKKPLRFRELNQEQKRELVARDPRYGRVVCRCETVTQGEVLDAIHAPVGAVDLDGVKRRVRVGAGRCQGGFCGPAALELLARELHMPREEITKCGGDSHILWKPRF